MGSYLNSAGESHSDVETKLRNALLREMLFLIPS